MEIGSNFSDIRKYIDLRLEETKLRVAKSISTILSQIAAYLIIIVLVIITVCFLVILEMQCLNECLGQPYGTLIAIGTLVFIIAILFLLRKRLFAGIFGKGIAGALGLVTNDVDGDLSAAAFAI